MAHTINNHLAKHKTVIVRGTVGESGISLYKTNGNDLPELYEIIAASGEKVVIIEPFVRVISSPCDQWVIQRDGYIGHLGVMDQICERGMVHVGTQQGPPISPRLHESITQTSLKIVNHMLKFGYRGVLGIDYIVTDEAVFPVENNARFNGSTYAQLIVDNLKKITPAIDYWKFIKTKTEPCSFLELVDRIQGILYDGEKTNSIFPYNCSTLSSTGDFTVILLAGNYSPLSV